MGAKHSHFSLKNCPDGLDSQHSYQKIAQKRGSQKAIVAIARRILVVIWHVWQKREQYYDTTLDAIQRKFTRWAYSNRLARSHGYTAKQFTELMMQKINLTVQSENLSHRT